MAQPLMPKATAVWLVENTILTFDQIADFCGLHPLEVQAIADDDVATGMQGLDPITHGELTQEEIDRCIKDPSAKLEMAAPRVNLPQKKKKRARYTPLSKRQDRPDAIAWLLKNYPELSDAQISKLIGTTKPTINAIREKTHWNSPNIKPQNPVSLGLCVSPDLEKAVNLARARAGTVHAPAAPPPAAETAQPVAIPPAPDTTPVAAPPAFEAPAAEATSPAAQSATEKPDEPDTPASAEAAKAAAEKLFGGSEDEAEKEEKEDKEDKAEQEG